MKRDYDDEFERLMGQANLSVDPEDEDGIPYEDVPENLEIEDVRPAEDGRRRVGLVLTELAHFEILQKILDTEGLDARALGTQTGAVAWVPVTSEEDEFASLLGASRPVAAEVEGVARTLSEILDRSVVALQSWLTVGDDEDDISVAGQIVAWRFTKGGPGEELHGGLVVASMDESVEDLLVGRTDPLTHEDFSPPTSAWEILKQAKQSWMNRRKGEQ